MLIPLPDDTILKQEEADDLLSWLQLTLGNRVKKTKVTQRLESHPCIITVSEMGAARHFLKTALVDKSEEEKFRVLQPTLEINPGHPVVRKLYTLKASDPALAKLVAEQVWVKKRVQNHGHLITVTHVVINLLQMVL